MKAGALMPEMISLIEMMKDGYVILYMILYQNQSQKEM
jgi:hypothetical protein